MKLHSAIKYRTLFCILFFAFSKPVGAQDSGLGKLVDIPVLGEIRGIVSLRNDGQSFLAVWYYSTQQDNSSSGRNILTIFERKSNKYDEVFRFNDSPGDGVWERLLPLYPGRLTGLILSASQISADDDTWLIALVDDKFKVVHHGSSTELLDINDDGYFEIFDSNWPDGDGKPKTTKVFVWDGQKYRQVIEMKFNLRFSNRVRNAVNKATRRAQVSSPQN